MTCFIKQYNLQGKCIAIDCGLHHTVLSLLKFLIEDDKTGQFIFESGIFYQGITEISAIDLTIDEIYEIAV